MKKAMIFLLGALMCISVGCSQKKQNNTEETRAIWISYIDYTQILWGKSETEYKQNLNELFLNLETLKINTIYVHASAFTDAYYDSKIYPTSQYATGTIDGSLSFDPLKIFVEKAKENKIKIEAWINPFRSFTKEQMSTVSNNYLIKQWVNEKSRNIIFYGDRYYLNPAYKDVQEMILEVVEELVKNYDLDGIHMDDYFYPDMVGTDFDSIEYKASKTDKTLSDWRRSNINTLIENISIKIKKINKKCNFSISPAGNIEYTTNTIYGDVATWIKNEWVDTIVPQIYFGFEHGTLPYDQCLKEWETLVSNTKVNLVVGLAAYKINTEDSYAQSGKNEWKNSSDILSRQVELARKAINYKGYSLFSYDSIFRTNSKQKVQEELNNLLH